MSKQKKMKHFKFPPLGGGGAKKIYLLLLALVLLGSSYGQIFPVQATTQLVPPYSVYLPDYATGVNNQLRVLLLNKDINQPGYKVKLKMTIELNGSIIMRTSENFNPAPITIEPNQPYSVEGSQLAPYLNSNYIDFIGYSKQEYEQKKGLPEGAYKICFTAYDYVRPDNVKVSNEACSYYYLSKNDPPFVNMPACGIFIMPLANTQENLVEKAGRWLSYVLILPWTNEEKNEWYNKVNGDLTQKFDGRFDNDEAKYLLIEKAKQYAQDKGREWNDVYGDAWKDLVFAEFTKESIERWNRELLKYSKEEYVISINPDGTQDKETEIDMMTYMNLGNGGNTNITFMWTPRHTSSPNSTLSTKYRLQLYAINPRADNAQLQAMANNAVQTTNPVFTIDNLDATQYMYGPTDPSLTDGLQYAWRVQAYDADGRDWFKNNGYSEVCYFTFGGMPENEDVPQMEQVQSFVANGDGERRGIGNWNQTGAYTNYKVRYRKKGGTGNWFDHNTDSLYAKLYDLEPNTVYEAQVQGKAGQFYGPFSAIDTFKTAAIAPPPGCGIPINATAGMSTVPLVGATPYMFFKVGKFEFMVDSIGAGNSPGYYTGKGSLSNIPFLNIVQTISMAMGSGQTQSNSGLKVQFTNIFVNNNREITQGEVYAVSRPLEEWVDGWNDYYETRRVEQQQRRNREQWSDLDSNAVSMTFTYEISAVSFDSATGVITIIDAQGNSHTVTLQPNQVGHDIIIQGANSNDQWVVRPDGSVVPVPGGGLYPGMNITVSNDDLNLLTTAIQNLRNAKFNQSYSDNLTSIYNTTKNERKHYIDESLQKMTTNTNPNLTGYKELLMSSNTFTSRDTSFANFQHLNLEKKFLYAELSLIQLESFKALERMSLDKEKLTVIAQILIVKDKKFVNFVKEKKASNIATNVFIKDIEEAFLGFCNLAIRKTLAIK